MIEITVLDYLQAQIPEISASLEKPETPPASYLVLQKTGTSNVDGIREATFAIQSYAPSLYEAIVLNGRVKAAMDAMGPPNGVFCAKLNTDYENTDIQTKEYRYQAVYEVYH